MHQFNKLLPYQQYCFDSNENLTHETSRKKFHHRRRSHKEKRINCWVVGAAARNLLLLVKRHGEYNNGPRLRKFRGLMYTYIHERKYRESRWGEKHTGEEKHPIARGTVHPRAAWRAGSKNAGVRWRENEERITPGRTWVCVDTDGIEDLRTKIYQNARC